MMCVSTKLYNLIQALLKNRVWIVIGIAVFFVLFVSIHAPCAGATRQLNALAATHVNHTAKYKNKALTPIVTPKIAKPSVGKPEFPEIFFEPVNFNKNSEVVNVSLKENLKTPLEVVNKGLQERSTLENVITAYSHVKGNLSKDAVKKILPIPSKKPEFVREKAHEVHIKPVNLHKSYKYNYDNPETDVMLLRINEKLAYNFEGIVWPDGSVSVPIKALAGLLEIPVTVNRATHSISFIKPSTEEEVFINFETNKSGLATRIRVGNDIFDNLAPEPVYIKEGFIMNDEIFISQDAAEYVLGVKINFNKEKYTINVSTSKALQAIAEYEESTKKSSSFVYEEPANTITNAEKENRMFKLKQVNYSLGSSLDKTVNGGKGNLNDAESANFASSGNLLKGIYNIASSASYGDSGMIVNGYNATLDYIGSEKRASIGKTFGKLSQLASPGASIWGAALGSKQTFGNSSTAPRYLTGRAENNTYSELFINDISAVKQLTQNNEYSFDLLDYPAASVRKIRIDQINQDGSRKIIYKRSFSINSNLLFKGQKEFFAFSGVDNSGFTTKFKLFGGNKTSESKFYEPIKYVMGSKFRMGVTEKLTMGVNFARDFIIRKPTELENGSVSNLSQTKIYRTGRSSQGQVISVDANYFPVENLQLASEAGYSLSSKQNSSDLSPHGSSFGSFVSADYRKEKFSLYSKAFSYSPNFYSVSSSALSDQRGIELNSSLNLKGASISGNIIRYNSNLDNYFNGGKSKMLDYGINIDGAINENSSLQFGIRSSSAKNRIYYNRDTDINIALTNRITDKCILILNNLRTIRRQSNYDLDTGSKSSINGFNVQLDYNAGKLGHLDFTNETTAMGPADALTLADYNRDFAETYSKSFRIRLDRSSLPIKGITLSPNIGYTYQGKNKGLLFGVNIGHIFKSGMQLILSYNYNSTYSPTIGGNLIVGGNRHHSLSINLVQTVNFGMGRLVDQKTGSRIAIDPESGVIKGTVFTDLNMNGIKDPGETGISEAEIAVQGLKKITADKKGDYILPNLSEGSYKISVDKDVLPVIYTPTVSNAIVEVKRKKTYVANLGVIVTPGSVSGSITVDKEGVNNTNVLISIFDKDNKEIKYTTTDSQGKYYVDSIPPGEYSVVINQDYLDYKGLQDASPEKQKITVPVIYDDFYDIEGINFKLIPKRGEIKRFRL